MTLVNAFGSLASEVTLVSVKTSIEGVETTLSALSSQLPATLGQQTKAGSTSVTLASDQDSLPVVGIDELNATMAEIGKIMQSLERAATLLARYQSALPRDASNQLRVAVGNSLTSNTIATMWSNNTWSSWYSTGGPNSMDARQQQTEFSRQSAIMYRNRWSFG